MYGWRARLGIIIPSSNIVTEPSFNLMTPEGVSCHYHRFRFKGGKSEAEVVERLKKAQDFIADASEMITHARPAVVVMAGTGVSFIGGYGYDQMLIEKMKERKTMMKDISTVTLRDTENASSTLTSPAISRAFTALMASPSAWKKLSMPTITPATRPPAVSLMPL